jgi:hypothetical protein
VLRKSKATEREQAGVREAILVAEKAARDAQGKADAIDASVYDLKAVNPRVRVVRDERTPMQIMEAIAAHGQAVEQALARLRAALA